MESTVPVRREAVVSTLSGASASPQISLLQKAHDILSSLPRKDGDIELLVDRDNATVIDITYEQEELRKDLIYFTKGEDELYRTFAFAIPTFEKELAYCLERMPDQVFRTFISDRDGTVNNYCARYLSSVQSAYNAVFLARFAQTATRNAAILTSAPLDKGGIVDISVAPDDAFTYAGSKGREFRKNDGTRGEFPIPHEQQQKLNALNAALDDLLKQPAYLVFPLIGSGFQRKFGQTTIARQDIVGSIPTEKSQAFLDTITALVKSHDPTDEFFRIEDTGKDIEIMLTVRSEDTADGLKDFDKGNGVSFLNEALHFGLSHGPNLICGDTPSDVPMLEEALRATPNTWGVFVTTDDSLRNRVTDLSENVTVVSAPDTLVATLNELGKRTKH